MYLLPKSVPPIKACLEITTRRSQSQGDLGGYISLSTLICLRAVSGQKVARPELAIKKQEITSPVCLNWVGVTRKLVDRFRKLVGF